MKSNELMIGDWVKFPSGNEKIIDLPYIPGMGICASFAASATLFPVEVEKLQPIPITPKILKKNGFGYIEKTEDITHYYLGGRNSCRLGLHIGTNNKGDYWVNTNYNDIYGLKYVHELQHAFRLFKLEKEIEP